MLALRSLHAPPEAPPEPALPRPNPADWLTLQQAACELNISASTARRMIRKGQLRNRIVPRRGGFAYLVYLPNSRHAKSTNGHACAPPNITELRPAYQTNGAVHAAPAHFDEVADKERTIQALQQQVDRLSDALSRTLKIKQTSLPPGIGASDGPDPYARYRWLVRRRRWWPF